MPLFKSINTPCPDPQNNRFVRGYQMSTATDHPNSHISHNFQPTFKDSSDSSYIGRFAPSPSGPLHMGSLIAAMASWFDARRANGKWLVRIEDLDPPRESQEAADQILDALDKVGLHWDDKVLYQSQRSEAYQNAMDSLIRQDLVFACNCSRQQIQESGGIYPGTCRERRLPAGVGTAMRLCVPDETISFTDAIQGEQIQNLEQQVGDFVIRRKDGLFAYQLAVVVDDIFQNVSHIVRGIDLMDSTPRQLYLQQLLACSRPTPYPSYAHIPVIVNDLGQKLSKQHMASPIDPSNGAPLLFAGLHYLQQEPDANLKTATCEEILTWGVTHWAPEKLSKTRTLPEFHRP